MACSRVGGVERGGRGRNYTFVESFFVALLSGLLLPFPQDHQSELQDPHCRIRKAQAGVYKVTSLSSTVVVFYASAICRAMGV